VTFGAFQARPLTLATEPPSAQRMQVSSKPGRSGKIGRGSAARIAYLWCPDGFALLGHISEIEKAFAATSNTRNWNTVTKLASLSS
jgi:hypothetical protein